MSPWGVDDLDLMASYDQFFRPSSKQAHRSSVSSTSSYSQQVANTLPATRHIYNQAYEFAPTSDPHSRRMQPESRSSVQNGGLLIPQNLVPSNPAYDSFDRVQRHQPEPSYPRYIYEQNSL